MADVKADSDDSSSEESDEASNEKKSSPAPNKLSSSDEESSSDSSDDERTKAQLHKKVSKKASKSDEESEEEETSSEEESSEEEEQQPSKAPKKKERDVEMVDVVLPTIESKQAAGKSGKKAHQTPVTPQIQTGGTKTLFVGNLSYSVEQADMEKFFKDAGEIVDVRFSVDSEGEFKGYGHVEFATEEAAQNVSFSSLSHSVELIICNCKQPRMYLSPTGGLHLVQN
ncbi:hypothetical protein U1Q18_001746 [Sarracenia purpurea var. burkii]